MMTPAYPVSLLLLVSVALHAGQADAQEMQWHDATTFTIEGKGWTDSATPYCRLPDAAQAKVNETAWNQSRDSAGICVRFSTDAPTLNVRWSLAREPLAMPHMPATGVSGIDLYARSTEGVWLFVGNGRPHTVDDNNATFEFPDTIPSLRDCMLYMPLYNAPESVEIGVPAGSVIEPGTPRPEGQQKPLVIYGTSITQGGCASRPGMAWTAILGRLLDRPVINLGFSASGSMEPPIGEILAEIDAAAYLIDCTWNLGDSQEVYNERVSHLVHAIRATRPDTPILFVGQSLIRPEAHPTDLTQRQENAVRSLQEAGVEGLTLIPADDLIGYDTEGTVDGVHLNDLGMDRQARCLFPIIRPLVNGPQKPRVYIDSDTANEIDDPYAIFRALAAPEMTVVGLSSMSWRDKNPFIDGTRESQKMNEEILTMMGLLEQVSHPLGAHQPMPDPATPVDSPAARDMVAKAHETPEGQKLHIFVLGAYTNVASALLLDPKIIEKTAVYVMGYNHIDNELQTKEFNCQGDQNAAQCLLASDVELHIMPASILQEFHWAKAEVDTHFKGKTGIREYLVQRWETWAPSSDQRILWDIAVFEAFLRPNLAKTEVISHEDHTIHVWTQVDKDAMQADYWATTKP